MNKMVIQKTTYALLCSLSLSFCMGSGADAAVPPEAREKWNTFVAANDMAGWFVKIIRDSEAPEGLTHKDALVLLWEHCVDKFFESIRSKNLQKSEHDSVQLSAALEKLFDEGLDSEVAPEKIHEFKMTMMEL